MCNTFFLRCKLNHLLLRALISYKKDISKLHVKKKKVYKNFVQLFIDLFILLRQWGVSLLRNNNI